MTAFADRLADVVRRKGPLCVGLDPRWESLPKEIRDGIVEEPEPAAKAVQQFCIRVMELVLPYCGVVKPQSAFFELLGPAGMAALRSVLDIARDMNHISILDAKRGDIASTAAAYADAAFDGCRIGDDTYPIWDADSLTINPYLGRDAVEPFLSAAKTAGRGVFVLVRTSNPGAGLFQDLVCDGKPVYRHVADEVAKWNAPTVGASGLGDVGAVVAATHPRELAELRAAMPDVWFLAPGYGAQGGTAADVRAAFRPDGLGAVVNSSRGVTFPFHPDDPDWEDAIVKAAQRAIGELSQAIPSAGH